MEEEDDDDDDKADLECVILYYLWECVAKESLIFSPLGTHQIKGHAKGNILWVHSVGIFCGYIL
jgi:hypothetical protein